MGRASRLRGNSERASYQEERQAKRERAAIERMRKGRRYVPARHRSVEEMARSAAMHEAGHVAAAFALDLHVDFSTLKVETDRTKAAVGGYTELQFGCLDDFGGDRQLAVRSASTPEMLHKRTVQALAAAVAESVVNRDDEDVDVGSTEDNLNAMRYAMKATGSDDVAVLTTYLNERKAEAFSIIRNAISEVIRLANHLLRHANERVDGDELRRVYEGLKGDEGA